MRYIFLASFATLVVIAGLLALPSIGEPHARLVAQTVSDRLTTAAAEELEAVTAPSGARRLVEPRGIETQVAGVGIDSSPASTDSPTTSSTAAPTTAPSTTTTTATTTTTIPPTTTSSSTTPTTAAPVDAPDTGGVLISSTGVVMPVIGRSASGWRVITPCGIEVTLDSGERVLGVDFVLDPGHGGSETGSVGPNGATEKALNRRIAEIVEWYLEREGFTVLLTRRSDYRLPLQTRADIANALDPRAFVSIHHNGGATRPQSTPGTEIFVDGGNPEARRLGGILFEELTSRMSNFDAEWVGTIRNGVSTRLNESGDDLYGIHRFTPGIPSVITEVGYLSNASEAELYVDNDVQWAHGRAIADGLLRWLRSSDEGGGYLADFVDPSSSGTGGFDGCVDPALY